MAKRKSSVSDKKTDRPPLMKRQQKTMLLAQKTVDLLEKARWDLRKSYGVLIDHAVAVVYGDPFESAPSVEAPAKPIPAKPRKAGSLPPDEYAEYCQMRGLYDAAQLSKSARGKDLVRLYESRYQREYRGA